MTPTSVNTLGAKQKGTDSITGKTEILIQDSSIMDKSMARATGRKVEQATLTSIKVVILRIRSMDMENSTGAQVANIKVSTSTMSKEGTERCTGLTAAFIEGFGMKGFKLALG